MIQIDAHRDGAVITVRVQPGARQNALVGTHGEMLKLKVSEPPERGKANDAVVHLLSQSLGIARQRFELLSGQTSRTKRLLVRDVTPAALSACVQSALEGL